MRVVIENTVCLNTGDAAILLAIRSILHKIYGPHTRIDVFDSQPETASKLYEKEIYPDITFRKLLSESVFKKKYRNDTAKNVIKDVYNSVLFILASRFGLEYGFGKLIFTKPQREDISVYRAADLVITTGGTYLVENYNLEKRLTQFRLDCAIGKPPVFFTQSLGPFNKPVNRAELTPVLDRSPLVLLRDERSLDHLRELGADLSRCHVIADSVFALADTARIRDLLSEPGARHSTGRVAVSVRHWNYVEGGDEGMRRYVDSIAAMVAELVTSHGKSVTFLSTCQGVAEYAHDDSKTAEMIVGALDPAIAEHVSVNRGFHRPEELMEEAKAFDFVISTRMHMMIMSLCVGTPVLPIAYEFKTRELSKRIGVSDVLLDIDSVTADEAVAKLDRFVADLPEYTHVSLENVLKEHASAMSAADLLRVAVPGSGKAPGNIPECASQGAA